MSGLVAPARIDWVERQLVTHRDLRDALQFLDARRARHVGGAHRTVGVAIGIDVRADFTTSPRVAWIGPGLAYDPMGRELLIDRNQSVAIPDEASGTVSVTLASDGCLPAVVVGVAWERRPVQMRNELPVATIDLGTGEVDTSRRPHVRTMAPPHLVGHRVEVGGAGAQGSTFGYTVAVDTSFAGFETSPLYLVQPSFVSAGETPAGLLGPMLDVHDVEPGRFSLTVRYLAPNAAVSAETNELSRQVTKNPFAFDWIGIEEQRTFGVSAPPPPPFVF